MRLCIRCSMLEELEIQRGLIMEDEASTRFPTLAYVNMVERNGVLRHLQEMVNVKTLLV
jgi:hypothetical protein